MAKVPNGNPRNSRITPEKVSVDALPKDSFVADLPGAIVHTRTETALERIFRVLTRFIIVIAGVLALGLAFMKSVDVLFTLADKGIQIEIARNFFTSLVAGVAGFMLGANSNKNSE